MEKSTTVKSKQKQQKKKWFTSYFISKKIDANARKSWHKTEGKQWAPGNIALQKKKSFGLALVQFQSVLSSVESLSGCRAHTDNLWAPFRDSSTLSKGQIIVQLRYTSLCMVPIVCYTARNGNSLLWHKQLTHIFQLLPVAQVTLVQLDICKCTTQNQNNPLRFSNVAAGVIFNGHHRPRQDTRVSVLLYFYKTGVWNDHNDQPVFKLPVIVNKSLREPIWTFRNKASFSELEKAWSGTRLCWRELHINVTNRSLIPFYMTK